jgi:hypothetical protein
MRNTRRSAWRPQNKKKTDTLPQQKTKEPGAYPAIELIIVDLPALRKPANPTTSMFPRPFFCVFCAFVCAKRTGTKWRA